MIVSNTTPISNFLLLSQLHAGEAEALCLCIDNDARLLLVDDRDARGIAHLHNIPVSGTLGILVQAKKMNLIESVKNQTDKLRNEHHYWVDETMYHHVLELSDEKK